MNHLVVTVIGCEDNLCVVSVVNTMNKTEHPYSRVYQESPPKTVESPGTRIKVA